MKQQVLLVHTIMMPYKGEFFNFFFFFFFFGGGVLIRISSFQIQRQHDISFVMPILDFNPLLLHTFRKLLHTEARFADNCTKQSHFKGDKFMGRYFCGGSKSIYKP